MVFQNLYLYFNGISKFVGSYLLFSINRILKPFLLNFGSFMATGLTWNGEVEQNFIETLVLNCI